MLINSVGSPVHIAPARVGSGDEGRLQSLWVFCTQPFLAFLQEADSRPRTHNLMVTTHKATFYHCARSPLLIISSVIKMKTEARKMLTFSLYSLAVASAWMFRSEIWALHWAIYEGKTNNIIRTTYSSQINKNILADNLLTNYIITSESFSDSSFWSIFILSWAPSSSLCTSLECLPKSWVLTATINMDRW